jgi:cyanophycin synthetase
VVGGKVVAAARGEIIGITGDGRSTVRQLIDSQLNPTRAAASKEFRSRPSSSRPTTRCSWRSSARA